MVGLDAGDTDFDAVTDTGGSKTHTLITAEMPAHTHTNWAAQETFDPIRTHATQAYANTSSPANYPPLADTGGGGAHNNLQPYVVVHMWKRTA
jgi:microcystin-dependent protein